MVALGRGRVFYERGTPVTPTLADLDPDPLDLIPNPYIEALKM